MTIVFAAFGSCESFPHAVAAARARSGCDVHVVCSVPNLIKDSILCRVEDMPAYTTDSSRWWLSHIKWAALRWYCENHPVRFPIYAPDWDTLILHGVSGVLNSLKDYDIADVFEPEQRVASAAVVIHSLDLLQAYCQYADSFDHSSRPSDMDIWRAFRDAARLRVINLAEERDGGVFDSNIFLGKDVYEYEGSGKRIIFRDGRPYFTRRSDGKELKAYCLHCWGEYKHRTGELLQSAGIPV